jgi:hypothetical protein
MCLRPDRRFGPAEGVERLFQPCGRDDQAYRKALETLRDIEGES